MNYLVVLGKSGPWTLCGLDRWLTCQPCLSAPDGFQAPGILHVVKNEYATFSFVLDFPVDLGLARLSPTMACRARPVVVPGWGLASRAHYSTIYLRSAPAHLSAGTNPWPMMESANRRSGLQHRHHPTLICSHLSPLLYLFCLLSAPLPYMSASR
jgi:hypothetical protein